MEYFVIYCYISFLIGIIAYYGLTFKVIKELEAQELIEEDSDVLKYQSLYSVIMIVLFALIAPVVLILFFNPKAYTENYKRRLLESE